MKLAKPTKRTNQPSVWGWLFNAFQNSSLVVIALLLAGCMGSLSQQIENSAQPLTAPQYFGVRFLDKSTGRGVPLVEMESNNGIRYVSDSAGWVAIHPDDFSTRRVYFHVRSHGYVAETYALGFRGMALDIIPGEVKEVYITRLNLAERMYRITGEGIYHDSKLLGFLPPFDSGYAPAGGVFGQDSVVNAIYKGKLYWFWGDTRRADGPLGNFKVAGAISENPEIVDVNPASGIELRYLVDASGFVRPVAAIEGDGAVWINGLLAFEEQGRELMFAHYGRWLSLGNRLESGIAQWDDETSTFKKRLQLSSDSLLHPKGHPMKLEEDGKSWFRFGQVFPDIRVGVSQAEILDPDSYQGYSCLKEGSRWEDVPPPLDRNENGNLVCGWKSGTAPISAEDWAALIDSGAASPEEYPNLLVDIDSGEIIVPHRGMVAWNEYLKRWVLIAVQIEGTSYLGEVWYADAPTPLGPWSKAKKIVTHDQYAFYNPKQHPYFAEGRYIYFEGTYTATLSATQQGTPRYDYNQIMYRLDLTDPRLRNRTTSGTP